MENKNNRNSGGGGGGEGQQRHLNIKSPYATTTTTNEDDDGLTTNNSSNTLTVQGRVNNGVHMMREIPSEAAFAINGSPGGVNDPSESSGWTSKTQFMLSIVGYSVGLGNIWRFPYLCQKNGGGAFLIPFLIMVVIQGAPLLLVELGIGQRLRTGSLNAWNMIHPGVGGIGLASTVVAFLVGLYYNVIITWCFFFLFKSITTTLPWATCPIDPNKPEISENGTVENRFVDECDKASETQYYWYREALDITPSIDILDGIRWPMAGCLLLSWVVIYLIIMRGIQSSGKVVYFTALFPYFVLTIFFFRGITLEGAGAGLLHMYTPKMHMLLQPSVWLSAATQVFYSFGLAFGSLIAFGSYNKPRNNCVQDVIFITITNACTAIYASVVIFSVLGFKATAIHSRCLAHNKFQMHVSNSTAYPNEHNITDDQLTDFLRNQYNSEDDVREPYRNCSLQGELDSAAAGTGLAFVVFTQAIVELPVSPFWSIIFFLMLLALGIGSQIGTMEGVVNTVFESSYFSHIRKEILTGVVCGISFLIGLLFVTGAGEYWVSLFDGYASTMGLVIVALLETVSVMYIYGHQRFSQDIEYMSGYYPGMYWQVCWRYLGPVALVVLLIGSVYDNLKESPTYKAWDKEKGEAYDREYPGWVMGLALFMILLGIVPIIVVWAMNYFNILPPSGRARSSSTTMRRIDTAASTRPMMEDYENSILGPKSMPQYLPMTPSSSPYKITEYRGHIPEDASDDNLEGGPIQMAPKPFKMEVIDC